MKSVAFHNLGCKVNSYEMDVMQQYFQKNNYFIVDFAQKADIYIINTCTVTNIADRKSRQMIHRAKALNPDAVVVAVGCYVQTHQKEVLSDLSIDLAVGNNRKKDLLSIVESFIKEREQGIPSEEKRGDKDKTDTDDTLSDEISENISAGDKCIVEDLDIKPEYEELELYKTAEHTRAYIKIQDGCNQFCSYCAIPLARGRVRSRKPEAVAAEVNRMAGAGYREIVLTGIHLSSYGLDLEGISYNHAFGANDDFPSSERLLELIDSISRTDGIDRIRLGSLEPRIITEDFAKALADNEKICPHFHLSLQSGCDSVLERMNRRYTCADFEKGVEILRKYFDDPAITTDIIAGFPGETQAEFEASLAFVKKTGFYETHIFPYSRRKGTAADKMPGQLTEKEKKERCRLYQELNEKNSASYAEEFLGKNLSVLFEREEEIDGCIHALGHTANYIEVAVKGEGLINSIKMCRLTSLSADGRVRGELI